MYTVGTVPCDGSNRKRTVGTVPGTKVFGTGTYLHHTVPGCRRTLALLHGHEIADISQYRLEVRHTGNLNAQHTIAYR